MSKSRDVSPEFIDLLEAACDGTLAERRIAELEKHLCDNDANQQLLIEYFRLDAELAAHCQNQKALEVVRRIEAEQLSTGLSLAKRWRQAKQLVTQPTPLSLSVAALVMCLIVTTMAFMVPPFYRAIANRNNGAQLDPQRVVAQLTGQLDAVWADGQAAPHDGAFLQAGRTLQLTSGFVEITFDSGAQAIVQGPARFTVDSENSAQISNGRLTALVPPSAIGFAVDSPTATLVDLGTEFEIEIDQQGTENLYVFDGAVRVNPAAARQLPQTVPAGQGIQWSATSGAIEYAKPGGERFAVIAGRLSSGATVLFYDNFNAVDTGNFDAAPLAYRRGGLLKDDVVLRSARTQQAIADQRLRMIRAPDGAGRIRFHQADSPQWYDWAAGASGKTITTAAKLRVDFLWIAPDDTSDNWISFNIGHPGLSVAEPATRVNHAETDYGILLRGNGGTQRFDNGVGVVTESFESSTERRHVIIELTFDSFDDGANVEVHVSVAGKQVDHHTFTWHNNGGQLYMEFGTLETGMLIDNLRLVALTVAKNIDGDE